MSERQRVHAGLCAWQHAAAGWDGPEEFCPKKADADSAFGYCREHTAQAHEESMHGDQRMADLAAHWHYAEPGGHDFGAVAEGDDAGCPVCGTGPGRPCDPAWAPEGERCGQKVNDDGPLTCTRWEGHEGSCADVAAYHRELGLDERRRQRATGRYAGRRSSPRQTGERRR